VAPFSMSARLEEQRADAVETTLTRMPHRR